MSHIHALFVPPLKIFSKNRECIHTEKTKFEREVLTNSLEQFIGEVGGIGSSHCSVGPSIFCLLPNCMGVSFVSVKNGTNIRVTRTEFCMGFSFVALPTKV